MKNSLFNLSNFKQITETLENIELYAKLAVTHSQDKSQIEKLEKHLISVDKGLSLQFENLKKLLEKKQDNNTEVLLEDIKSSINEKSSSTEVLLNTLSSSINNKIHSSLRISYISTGIIIGIAISFIGYVLFS